MTDGDSRTRSLSRLELVVVALLLLGVACIHVVWSKGRSPIRIPGKRCVANLKQIGLGCIQYAEKNQDRLPDRDGIDFLSAIYQYQVRDARVFVCPRDEDSRPCEGAVLQAANTSYCGRKNQGAVHRLTGGRWARDRKREPLAADKSSEYHDEARIVLFADGHAEELSEEEFGPHRAILSPIE